MNRKLWIAGQYLKYRMLSKTKFKVHSPFVYQLYTDIILNNSRHSDFEKIEEQRSILLRQRSLLETTDFGAFSSGNAYKTRFRQVKNITRHSSLRPKDARLVYHLVKEAKPETILEMGTAMGISTMYMAMAAPESKIVTMEGCAVIGEKARENFNKFKLDNIDMVLGNFNNSLTKTLSKFDRLDFVLIDGNHRQKPTLDYFMSILPKLHAESIVLIDDIHWSKEMLQAWNTIRQHPDVTVSIDLFKAGILLFRKDIAKENHVLRF